MAQKMLEFLKTIPQIAAMDWSSGIRDQLFTVVGTVFGVDEEGGWYYPTCSQCSKNLDVISGAFWCRICNGSSLYPMARYRIHLRVQDSGGEAIFTLYNQQAERLLDTCANKLVNRLGIGSNGLPKELRDLAGRIFVFTITMPDYGNPDYDYHHHRVVRLYEVEPVPPVSVAPRRRRKVKRKRSAPAVLLLDSDAKPSNGKEPCVSAESTNASAPAVAEANP